MQTLLWAIGIIVGIGIIFLLLKTAKKRGNPPGSQPPGTNMPE